MKKPSLKQATIAVLGLVITGYVLMSAVAFFHQRNMLYHPDKAMQAPESYDKLPMAEFQIASEDGVKITLWYRPANPGMPTLVFFHGNSGNLGGRAAKLRTFIDSKLGVLAVSYRGFGSSEGSPTEEGIYKDARAALVWLATKGVPQKETVLYGESLGTAVAVEMAKEFPGMRAVVLEAPFASMAAVGRVHYPYLPVSLLLRDRFDSIDKVKDVHIPLLIIHGLDDKVVPVEEGKELLEKANAPKQGHFIPGMGHSNLDMPSVIVYMKTFLAVKTAPATPSKAGGGITLQRGLPQLNPELLKARFKGDAQKQP